MTVSVSLIRELFDKYNKELFENKLPYVNIRISTRLKNAYGRFSYTRTRETAIPRHITIATNIISYDINTLSNVLIHEMIHLYECIYTPAFRFKEYDTHGIKFQEIAKQINERGFNIVTTLPKEEVKELLKGETYYIFFKNLKGKKCFVTCTKGSLKTIVQEILYWGGGYNMFYVSIPNKDTEQGYKSIRKFKAYYISNPENCLYDKCEKLPNKVTVKTKLDNSIQNAVEAVAAMSV